jgi:hypothetical protein
MQKSMLIVSALLVTGAATIAGSAPAAAVEYPYCIQGGGFGVPGECSYRSYAECQASASGRRVYCGINPRFTLNRRAPRDRSY